MSFNAGAVMSTLGVDISPFARGMLEASSIARVFPTTVQNFIASPLLGIAGIARSAAHSLADVFKSALGGGIKLAADYEQASVAFTVMLGSAEKAKDTLKALSDFAAATPFELPELIAAGRKLLAFGTTAEQLIPTLQKVGDVSSGIGAPIGEIAEIFGKAKVQGRLFMEDINQLTGRGIPIIQELAKQFHVTEDAVRGLVEAGQIGFPNLDKAFSSMTGSGGQFGGLMEKQSHTLAGLWSTMKDTWGQLTMAMAQPVADAIKPMLERLTAWLGNTPDVKAKFEAIGNTVKDAMETAGKAVVFVTDHSEAFLGVLKAIVGYKLIFGFGGMLVDMWKAVAAAANVAAKAQTAAATAGGWGFGGGAGKFRGAGGAMAGIGGAAAGYAQYGNAGGAIGGGLGGVGGFFAGAAIGSAFGPLGTIIGGIIGGIAGQQGGAWAGNKVQNSITVQKVVVNGSNGQVGRSFEEELQKGLDANMSLLDAQIHARRVQHGSEAPFPD
jgi:tape measure domain-containing protein